MSDTQRAAIYCRVSTDEQAREGMSLAAQERTLRARAAADGAEVVACFVDAVSGAKNDRPEYVRMLAAATAGEIEAVYVWKLDRFGRDAEELLRARRMLGAAGVRLISATEGEDESTLVFGVRALVAQEEREKIAERTAHSLREIARDGRYPWGLPPYGYRLVDGRLEVVPAEAEIVRRIFREYLDGKGDTAVTRSLRADNLRTRPSKKCPDGAAFSVSRVSDILKRRVYLGEIVAGDETLATGAHEAIIDAETFERANRLRSTRRSNTSGGRGRPAKKHLLAGLLRCPHGHSMMAKSSKGGEFYICRQRHIYHDCDAPIIARRKVDSTIINHFLNRHFDADTERERLLAAAREKGAESRELAIQADREEQEAEAALLRIKRDYQRGAITAEDWNEQRVELTEEAQASRNRAALLRARSAELEAEAGQVDTEAELASRVTSILQAAAGNVDDPEGVTAMRAALAATFDRIVLAPAGGPLPDVPTEAPWVWGETELVPVLRADVVVANKHPHGWGFGME